MKGFFLAITAGILAMFLVVAPAYAVTIVGTPQRVALVADYLSAKGVSIDRQLSSREVVGTFRGKPWPGVNVTSDGNPGSGIFVPVSDNALKKGLCSDQKRLLNTFIVPAPEIVSTPQACDERGFTGQVPNAVLEATAGKPADALEVHFRAGNALPYKVKRIHVADNGEASPVTWPDGRCMRVYASEPFTEAQLQRLLHPKEKIRPIGGTDVGRKIVGAHNTVAVYLIE